MKKNVVIQIAKEDDLSCVKEIVSETIEAIYPHYYPRGAVDFFLKHHSEEKIRNDLKENAVFLLIAEEKTVGTVTINNNEINRLFVLPDEQKKGYGTAALDFAEYKVFETYDKVQLHASFPAKAIYIKRGYREVEYRMGKMENGDYLCNDIMMLNREDR